MALTQDGPAPYAPTSAIVSVLDRSRARGLPPTIDKDALLRMGISESLAPRTLQALQILDLINDDGTHTQTLEKLRVAPEADYKNHLAEWLNAVYADILHYVNPEEGDDASVRDAFRPYKPHSMQDRMLTLFTGLYGVAGIWPEGAQKARIGRPKANATKGEKKKIPPTPQGNTPNPNPPSLKDPNAPGGKNQLTEKALEYRLVDLMSEAAGNEEVMKSIVNVITFLKTKEFDETTESGKDTG